MKRRVAIVGTQGVPANYGGFESLVENLIDSDNMEYTVFCSSKDMQSRMDTYKGAKLKYIPLKANGVQSIPYDILSLISAIWGYDVVLILGVSGAIFLPIFRLFSRAKVVTNVDGLEHRRAKWGRMARWFLKLSERIAVRFSHTIIADNQGIVDYLKEEYGADSELIAYGGDHVMQSVDADFAVQVLENYGVKPFEYAFALCRIEPENNCHIILEAAAKSGMKLLFVDPVYDLKKLYVLRSNAARYIHGHSAGGTNPSLVEAMFFGREIAAFDVVYNRETTQNKALYFADADALAALLVQSAAENKELLQIAGTIYTWAAIRDKYERLF